jgi:putative hemolysin
MPSEREPFDLRSALPGLAGEGWRGGVRRALDHALGLPEIRRRFRTAAAASHGEDFARTLEAFGIEVDAAGLDAALPSSGPVVVMANHPFGGADALALGALCRARRVDSLFLANSLATAVPGIGRHMIPLSILGEDDAARTNAAGLRRALGHLQKGGLLAVFPAGEVARWRGGEVAEGPWLPQTLALARKTAATLVLLHYAGRAPAWWHLAGAAHPLVRTALLPRVLLAMRGTRIQCRAFRFDPAPLAGLDLGAAAAELRRRTLAQADGTV